MTTDNGHDPFEEGINTDMLPPECLLDSDNPANDQYLRQIEAIKRLIVAQSAIMRPTQIEIVKKRHLGKRTKDIAAEVELTPIAVSRNLKDPKSQRLLALLSHLSLLMDGPREAQRINLLSRIANRNELIDPRVSIAAIAEINKMHHQGNVLAKGGNGPSNVVQIVINNETFPRGVLDV